MLLSESAEQEIRKARMLKSAVGKPRRHSPDVPRSWVGELFLEENLHIPLDGPTSVVDTVVKRVFVALVPPLLVHTVEAICG